MLAHGVAKTQQRVPRNAHGSERCFRWVVQLLLRVLCFLQPKRTADVATGRAPDRKINPVESQSQAV